MGGLFMPIRDENESKDDQEEELLTVNTTSVRAEQHTFSLSSPEDILDLLKASPDKHLLNRALRWLNLSTERQKGFNIRKPGPKAAQIIYVLVSTIIPDYWTLFKEANNSESSREKRSLLRCLRSVAGIGAIISHLRLRIGQLKESQGQTDVANSNKGRPLEELLDVAGDVLGGDINAQITLMLAGYAHRADTTGLINLSRSSTYLNAISNRLAASSERARLLGMIVGNAISELVDPADKKMKFSFDEMNHLDRQWYSRLTRVNDIVGCISDLKSPHISSNESLVTRMENASNNEPLGRASSSAKPSSKIIAIEEVNDSSESEAEDLPIYEKPDSDHSDEDEDPTLVVRDRPTAPVYIRDLIAGLRDAENFDRHKLALKTASNLIRRKASFGTEVSDNVVELATLLVGLSDRWEFEDFQKMRLQGMIAVLTAEPMKMGQWFSETFYSGEYSMGQRVSVLTTLGLGARELAGLGMGDAALTGANAAETSFPSKTLPDKLHRLYALEAAPTNAISQKLQKTMIQPMAAEAVDKVTGPSALKVRTFSSRMAVEKKRQKPIPNALAKIVAEGFFFPLTGRWRIHLQSYGESTSHTNPFLLSHLLKTLSLILHASGTSTLSLPQMTSEFWDLLLSLRSRGGDPSILEALLFSFLTLLDINENDQGRLAELHAKELLETQGWVEGVFENVGGGSEEGDRIRMLAAGVLMRTREVVEKYQRLLMGDLVDYM
ncbi:telomere length regulation protein, partial [Lecanoromycetidae sp. Uapishka_2]